MFVQPCLIKKNTTKIRKRLEEIGYSRVLLKSDDPEYNNDKEPWIICMYDMYVCTDKDFAKQMESDIKNNPMLNDEEYKHLSSEVIDCKKDEELFFTTAQKQ